ncbi:F-box only protein 32-like [Ruditapes philippinarum]|uniref:F-box only protein 32-like n=1 Tax=Ruditapes philippinarum TaxID=129788 RepID=UPI00295AD911|nr:F-box only protein 32-like [Ruditapes philippinarum]
MPYLGRDWRSPGDEWVRTGKGWEKLKLWRVKVFENLNSHCLARILRMALEEWDTCYDDLHNVHRPYIRYIRATSREQKVLTSISEAFVHLDMSTAGKDLRRFNYVNKLLKLLVCDKIAFLSGAVQKHIFGIMEEMVSDVIRSQNNVTEMRRLVNFAARSLNEHRTDHIAEFTLFISSLVIFVCFTGISPICIFLIYLQRKDDGKLTFTDLPEECRRHIITTLPDHMDILHLGQTNASNNHIVNDQLLWKQMCFFHFNKRQILNFHNQNDDESHTDWKYIYKRCYLRFGRRETYADMLAICRHCNNIFWQSLGHPCVSDLPPKCKVLSPEEFIGLFQF